MTFQTIKYIMDEEISDEEEEDKPLEEEITEEFHDSPMSCSSIRHVNKINPNSGCGVSTGLRGRRYGRFYGLRPKATGRRSSWTDEHPAAGNILRHPAPGSEKIRHRKGPANLKSKYRRHTANARERDRMKEINVAFANLRGALPSFTCKRISSMTKIKTLKLASSYIKTLNDILNDSPNEKSKQLTFQLYNDTPTNYFSSINLSNKIKLHESKSNHYLNKSDPLCEQSTTIIEPYIDCVGQSIDRRGNQKTISALRTALSSPLNQSLNRAAFDPKEINKSKGEMARSDSITASTIYLKNDDSSYLKNDDSSYLKNVDSSSTTYLNNDGNSPIIASTTYLKNNDSSYLKNDDGSYFQKDDNNPITAPYLKNDDSSSITAAAIFLKNDDSNSLDLNSFAGHSSISLPQGDSCCQIKNATVQISKEGEHFFHQFIDHSQFACLNNSAEINEQTSSHFIDFSRTNIEELSSKKANMFSDMITNERNPADDKFSHSATMLMNDPFNGSSPRDGLHTKELFPTPTCHNDLPRVEKECEVTSCSLSVHTLPADIYGENNTLDDMYRLASTTPHHQQGINGCERGESMRFQSSSNPAGNAATSGMCATWNLWANKSCPQESTSKSLNGGEAINDNLNSLKRENLNKGLANTQGDIPTDTIEFENTSEDKFFVDFNQNNIHFST